ncbi:HIT family protein [uncultured Paraglaciecola sp.]|uniref:HIT domain-containing protein n=1 Tax=uncultured Paraglaciecola sp. TaxID=1765024 RepID=UPI002594D4E8|nr:HIT family protein [uncultured Paraglaciecola sp.]
MAEFVLDPQLDRDSIWVTDLPLCSVRLINDMNYPWLILVPKVANISEVIELSEQQQHTLWRESALVSEVLTQLFTPDKLNLAALGNMVPQLHLHHIVRFKDDVSWPKPIWGQFPAKPYVESALNKRITIIQAAINKGA